MGLIGPIEQMGRNRQEEQAIAGEEMRMVPETSAAQQSPVDSDKENNRDEGTTERPR
jgi:hypothetical protein